MEVKSQRMKSSVIKYFIGFMLVAVLGYNSVFFERLDAHNLSTSKTGFDGAGFARNLFDNELIPRLDSAVELRSLLVLLNENPEQAFEDYSHSLAIGNVRYFLVRGEGAISSIGENTIHITLKGDATNSVIPVTTEFIYGNAIRDASGLINLSEFDNTADVNKVSEEINNIVRNEVLAAFTVNAKAGDKVKFVGAIELNRVHVDVSSIEVVPIQISVVR
jgi:predicted lipoprotein